MCFIGVGKIFLKGPDTKYFQFLDYMVFVAVIHFCHYSRKSVIGNSKHMAKLQ